MARRRCTRYGVRVQLTPRMVFVPVELATKPNVVDALGASTPLYARLLNVYGLAVSFVLAPQTWLIVTPLAKVMVTAQELVAVVPVLVTVAWPWKPPGHILTKLYAAAHVPWLGGDTDADGEAEAG